MGRKKNECNVPVVCYNDVGSKSGQYNGLSPPRSISQNFAPSILCAHSNPKTFFFSFFLLSPPRRHRPLPSFHFILFLSQLKSKFFYFYSFFSSFSLSSQGNGKVARIGYTDTHTHLKKKGTKDMTLGVCIGEENKKKNLSCKKTKGRERGTLKTRSEIGIGKKKKKKSICAKPHIISVSVCMQYRRETRFTRCVFHL